MQNADGVNVDTTFRSVELTDSVQIVTMTFKADTTADNMKIVVYMGGGAGAYGVYLEKAEIYSSTGVENLTEVYKQDFSDAAVMNGVANTAFDEVSVLSLSEGKLKVEIPNYPENREEVWLRSFSVATDLDLKEGSSYRVTASVTATAAQTYYINYENAELAFESRAGQNGGTWTVGGNALSVDFTASKDLENMSFHFQLGKAPAETASNVITIDDLKVEEITSVPDTVKETTRFMPYGENTGYDVFNGSDDTSGKFDGTGRIYTDGGALHYIVSNVGSVDYYNKVIFRLELEEMATYKFVFKAKADKEVKGAFLVNLTNGAYDPIALAFPCSRQKRRSLPCLRQGTCFWIILTISFTSAAARTTRAKARCISKSAISECIRSHSGDTDDQKNSCARALRGGGAGLLLPRRLRETAQRGL